MTKEKWKIHFHYYRMIYLIVIAVAVMAGSLIFTMTEYRAPNERRVDVELVGLYADTDAEACRTLKEQLLEAGREYERQADAERGVDVTAPDYETPLQEVEILCIGYDENGSSEESYYALQKYMVTLAAQEGDIYVLGRNQLTDLVNQNVLVPLDDYIELGVIDPGDRDLAKVTFDEMNDDGIGTGEQHIYALQASSMTGFISTMSFNPEDKYLAIMQFSRNQDTAAAVMQRMIELLDAPAEEAAETTEADEESAGEAAEPTETEDESAEEPVEPAESEEEPVEAE